jgi:UDP-N-acetyl-D-mannosaminuronic acid dehydrogenase
MKLVKPKWLMTGEKLDALKLKIENREAVIGVVGVGYIGLPTAAIFASEGFQVIGVDLDERKVSSLNKGECYISEPGLEEIVASAVEGGLLAASTDHSALAECDILMFCTQTPLFPDGRTNLTMLFSAVDSVIPHAKDGILVICESTVPPGTTREISERFTKSGKHSLDGNLWASHCPERVLPGRVVEEFRKNTRVVGGLTEASTEITRALYLNIVSEEKIKETNSTVSEFAKLAENIYRDVNIALANEFAKVADVLGVDVSEVISLANHHPRVNIHRPGVGVGGHCIPKDPVLLANAALEHGLTTDLIRTARSVNIGMPAYSIVWLDAALGGFGLRGKKVLVLGTTFKENVSDTRLAPAKWIIKELEERGAVVRAHDSHTTERFDAIDEPNLQTGVEWADIVFLTVAHSDYLDMIPGLSFEDKLFFDGRNAFNPQELRGGNYIGIGRCDASWDNKV